MTISINVYTASHGRIELMERSLESGLTSGLIDLKL